MRRLFIGACEIQLNILLDPTVYDITRVVEARGLSVLVISHLYYGTSASPGAVYPDT